jgi:hypothetical protein
MTTSKTSPIGIMTGRSSMILLPSNKGLDMICTFSSLSVSSYTGSSFFSLQMIKVKIRLPLPFASLRDANIVMFRQRISSPATTTMAE